jgi:hypothetical protein
MNQAPTKILKGGIDESSTNKNIIKGGNDESGPDKSTGLDKST